MNSLGAEVDEADQAVGTVESVAAPADQSDLGVQALEPGVAQLESTRGDSADAGFPTCPRARTASPGGSV